MYCCLHGIITVSVMGLLFNMLIKLWKKYREIFFYLVFGAATTVVNILVYFLFAHEWKIEVVPSTAGAWIVSVLFAYITNKFWVFESRTREIKLLLREVTIFFFSRLATGIVDVLMMYLGVEILQISDVIMKVIANIVVIVLNYAASKILIFKKE